MKKLREHAAIKIIIGMLLLLVIFSLVVSAIAYRTFSKALLTQYAEGAFLTAETAAQYVNPVRIDDYAASGGVTHEYRRVWSQLDQLCNSLGATFIYVIEPDRSDYAHITFLFSTINHDSDFPVYPFGYVRDTTNDEYRQKYRALYDNKADRELVIRDKGYIETDPHITAMIGLKDQDGQVRAILCVQRQMDVLVKARQSYFNRVILALVLLVLLVSAGQNIFLHYSLLRPLEQIAQEAKRFSLENVAGGKKLQDTIRKHDEIGQLAVSIDQMEERIQDYVENLTKITAEKERISTELELGTKIQAAMLPSTFPAFPDRSEFDLYASMDPAKEVGGDFYDFFLIDEDHLCVLIADVSGKGVPAALFMMACKIILANNAMSGKTPGQILADTNMAICYNNQAEMFVTVWLGILEISTGKLTAANAGHEYPVLTKPDGSFELYKDKHGFIVGGMDGVKYQEYELQIKPGSKLFVYTDGVPEATDAEGSMFGTERMLNALNTDPGGNPQRILESVRQSVDRFVKDAEQFDDLTMLCLEYKGPSL